MRYTILSCFRKTATDRIVIAASRQPAFRCRKPLRRGLHPGRIGRTVRQTEQAAQPGEGLPVMGLPMCHTDKRPSRCKIAKPYFNPST